MVKRFFGFLMLVAALSMLLVGCATQQVDPNANTGDTGIGSISTTSTTTNGSFKVTKAEVSVNPTSIAGVPCGTKAKITYKALFTTEGANGGTINFSYTLNNGRSEQQASVKVDAGKTSATYEFVWEDLLPVDNTYPGLGAVLVSSPNTIQSNSIKPNGTCTPPK